MQEEEDHQHRIEEIVGKERIIVFERVHPSAVD